MNCAARTSSPWLDEPWRRLVWIAPLSALLWAAALLGFSVLLRRTAAPAADLKPIEARLVELPPAGGLQGGPAPAARPAAAKPHPAVARRPAPVVHSRAKIHHPHKVKPAVLPPPLSPAGAAKAAVPAASNPAASASGATHGNAEGGGVAGGRGSGAGSGIGGDSAGARALFAPAPEIPDDLRERAFQAVAIARFKVTYDGRAEVSLITPTGNPRLNELLLNTLKEWRFAPAVNNGVAVDSEFDVRIPITVQ